MSKNARGPLDVTSEQALKVMADLRPSKPARFTGKEFSIMCKLELYGLVQRRDTPGGRTFEITAAGVRFKNMWTELRNLKLFKN